ncbi:two component transcriptional regulator, LuxR family [Fulvivirga imtechensis AK7]|uniref:Two component transcriptional regulator, LuxR family n=1 Tax=Fulvivirga imtechensis AK7 TaxID=1237149 RepID=L8JLV5_9BACT|nr:response regulator transcription factor [Fulvivirga imtechensis]ELR69213.1 two component transcriptional regulator, LuxR family [Fulvivirga imtechensis AK7]
MNDLKEINIMIVDDHKMFLDGITSLLKEHSGFNIVASAKDGNEALTKLTVNNSIDVLITDISMPDLDGEALCKEVKRKYPDINILALSMHSDSKSIKKVLRNGASGYILKNTGQEELIEAIQQVAQGQTYFSEKVKNNIMAGMTGTEEDDDYQKIRLTKREVEILKLIASEYTTNQIADKLFISLHTVESHRKNIMRKTKAKNMAGLIKYAVKEGIVE